mmetsp:Transcript_87667/g.265994  ORF Transcript_87667/g.265994 Transcript_87667/m.265994 type:complete len:237 (+) Transcript_87667:490-1200(+)
MRSPSRLNRNTALSKMWLDSEKSVSAGKKVDQTFQNSGGDFVSVSTSNCARLAKVSKTRTDVSSISRILCSNGSAEVRSPRLKSRPGASGTPSRHCSMNDTTTSLRVSIILDNSSDSWTMLRTRGLMISAAGFTNRAGCCIPASAPTEVCGVVTAFRSSCFPLMPVFCFSPLFSLPRSCVALPESALTRTSSMCTESWSSSLLDVSKSVPCKPLFSRRSCLMSKGASAAFCTRRSS